MMKETNKHKKRMAMVGFFSIFGDKINDDKRCVCVCDFFLLPFFSYSFFLAQPLKIFNGVMKGM